MSDLIDRAAAIDAIKAASKEIQHWLWEAEGCEGYCAMVADVETCLDDLPSVQPERKTGKWILDDEYIDCSACKREKWSRVPYESLVKRFRFCPNCGADMRGEQDGSD